MGLANDLAHHICRSLNNTVLHDNLPKTDRDTDRRDGDGEKNMEWVESCSPSIYPLQALSFLLDTLKS